MPVDTPETPPDADQWDAARALLPPLTMPPRRVYVRAQPVPAGGTPQPPGSKYYTLRYLLNALLASGESIVRFPALSDDTAVLVRAIRALGARAIWERLDGEGGAAPAWQLRVHGTSGHPQPPGGAIQAGNAGAVLRLLLGICATLPEIRFETDHPQSLGQRPNADLLDALRVLGLSVEAGEPGGLLPIVMRGGPPRGGSVAISGARSSQYLSALLYLAPLLPLGLDITIRDELRSAPLARATLRALRAAGIHYDAAPDLRRIRVPGDQRYQPRVYDVPGDGPTAAALASAALTLRVPLRIERLDAEDDDVRGMIAALDALGAPIVERPTPATGGTLRLSAGAQPHGATIDGDACIDSVPALVAAACFASGDTRFERVATLRLKESDRIGDLCAELARAGCAVEPHADAIVTHGRPEGIAGGAEVSGHDDHRLVQALAIAALRSRDGLTLGGADAVAKSYPWFFEDLARLGAIVRPLD